MTGRESGTQESPSPAEGRAVYMVIAWRLMVLLSFERQFPSLPANVVFGDLEIEVMEAASEKKAYQKHLRQDSADIAIRRVHVP